MIIRNRIGAVTTVISNRFIDEYMAEANGEFVKVYLYLLRLAQDSAEEISIAGIADRLNHTEKDVQRALRYWEKQHWLSLEIGRDRKLIAVELCEPVQENSVLSNPTSAETGAALTDEPVPAEAPEVAAEPVSPAKEGTVSTPAKRTMTPEMMAQLQADDEFAQVTTMAEMYLGRTLGPKDLQLFAYLYEDLHFTEDLLEYLVGYCVEGGHRSCRYIETVALGWHQEGLMTVEQAKEAHQAYSKENKAVMKAFGITGRILNNEERGYVDKWFNTYRMPLSVVVEACQITLAATQKSSFPYADKILSDWNDAGVRTPDAVKQYRESRKAAGQKGKQSADQTSSPASRTDGGNRFRNYQQRNIDYDALLNQGGMNPYGEGNS